MNNLIVLPTANLPGMGLLGQIVKGWIFCPGMTPVQRLEHEKAIVRACKMPAANDSEFNPEPVPA